jgi:hypothetical protein
MPSEDTVNIMAPIRQQAQAIPEPLSPEQNPSSTSATGEPVPSDPLLPTLVLGAPPAVGRAASAEAVRLDPKRFGPAFQRHFPTPVAPPPHEVKPSGAEREIFP